MKSKFLRSICSWALLGGLVSAGACAGPAKSPQPDRPKAPDFYQGELTWDNVEFVLHSSSVGRLITNDDENPYSVPVSFGYCRERIYIHSTGMGKKMQNIEADPKVSFAVDRYNEREGWASIIIYGTARVAADAQDKSLALQRFATAYKNPPEEIEKLAVAIKPKPLPPMDLTMIEITPGKVTSRLLPVRAELMPKYPYLADTQIPEPGNLALPEAEAKIFGGRLPPDLVKWLLGSGAVGRLNVFTPTYPDSAPADYAYSDGRIYVRLQNRDPKIAQIKKDSRVSFSIDRITPDLSGWKADLPSLGGISHSLALPETAGLLLWLSVNVFGEARIIEGTADTQIEITPRLITSKASHLAMKLPKMVYTFQEPLLKH